MGTLIANSSQSDNEIRQLVMMQGTVLTTLLERSRNPHRFNSRSRPNDNEEASDGESIISTASAVGTVTQFDFDANIIGARSYQSRQGRAMTDNMSLQAVASLADSDSYISRRLSNGTVFYDASTGGSSVDLAVGPDSVELLSSQPPDPAMQTDADTWIDYMTTVSSAFNTSLRLEELNGSESAVRGETSDGLQANRTITSPESGVDMPPAQDSMAEDSAASLYQLNIGLKMLMCSD